MAVSMPPIFAALAGLLGLLFMALAFSTDNWLVITVDRVKLKLSIQLSTDPNVHKAVTSDPTYFTRDRGIFRTCYPGPETGFLELPQFVDRVVDNICLWEDGYQLKQRDPDTLKYGAPYERRMHLMRGHFGLFVFAMATLIFSLIMTGCACVRTSEVWLRYSGLGVFFAGFMAAGGMACFHGYNYLEHYSLNFPPFRAFFLNNAPLQGYCGASYGWSYICGWIGVVLSLISSIVFIVSANSFTVGERHDDYYDSKMAMGQRNRAYDDVMAGNVIGGYPPAYDYPTIGGPGGAIMYDQNALMNPYAKAPLALEYPVDYTGSHFSMGKY